MLITCQKTKKYDCIIPFSGGVESTALVYDCVSRGLNPLCFHVETGTYWQQQVEAVTTMANLLNVDLQIIEYFNSDPCVDREVTSEHYNKLWGGASPPMFFTWTNIAQLVNLSNPQIHKIYYGFNADSDKHTDWVDGHFRSIERVLGQLNIPTVMSAPLAHMSKGAQWAAIPEELQQHVHTCVHPTDRHCGRCIKCQEFNMLIAK